MNRTEIASDPMVKACPMCGAEHRVYKCEHEAGPLEPVEMAASAARRIRELTEECLASCTIGGITVRLYRHAGVQLGGKGTEGRISFNHGDAIRLREFLSDIRVRYPNGKRD